MSLLWYRVLSVFDLTFVKRILQRVKYGELETPSWKEYKRKDIYITKSETGQESTAHIEIGFYSLNRWYKEFKFLIGHYYLTEKNIVDIFLRSKKKKETDFVRGIVMVKL